MIRDTCRHYDASSDFCRERSIASPESSCRGCKSLEPHAAGLGDALEKLIGIATLGLAKKGAKAKKGGCGCNKRRAALNRLTQGKPAE